MYLTFHMLADVYTNLSENLEVSWTPLAWYLLLCLMTDIITDQRWYFYSVTWRLPTYCNAHPAVRCTVVTTEPHKWVCFLVQIKLPWLLFYLQQVPQLQLQQHHNCVLKYLWYELLSAVSINLTLLQYVTSCRETCCLHFYSRWPSERTLTLDVTSYSRTLVPTHHNVWHHNSDNTDIRLWGAVASLHNLVELAKKLDTQVTQGGNFMFSYWYICCACWARNCTMKCEVKAVGKQPLSETDRNGRTTLKWISGKCAMEALTKFRMLWDRLP